MERNLVDMAFIKAMRLDDNFALEDQMTFDDVPGWDSVGHMNLVSELESQFGISLDMDEIVALDSVKSVRELVTRKKSALT
jgi:acyl carrier protein